jgi:prohibitin 1
MHQTVGADYKGKLVSPALSEVFKGASAKYNAGELITNRSALKNDVYTQLRDRLGKYGISVEDVSITNFQFSPSFSKAIEDKQVAQQNAERAKFNLEAAKTNAEAQEAQSETLSQAYLQMQAIEKWDGKMPQYVGGEGSVFGIPLKK